MSESMVEKLMDAIKFMNKQDEEIARLREWVEKLTLKLGNLAISNLKAQNRAARENDRLKTENKKLREEGR